MVSNCFLIMLYHRVVLPCDEHGSHLTSVCLALDLLEKLLSFDPASRPTASEALDHPFLRDVRDPDSEVWTLAAGTVYS